MSLIIIAPLVVVGCQAIGFAVAFLLRRRELLRERQVQEREAALRRDWYERGFNDGDYARRFVCAKWWASESESYRATFEADCQPGGQWEKAVRLFGKAGVEP